MKQLNGAGTRVLEMIKQFTAPQRAIAIIGVAVLVLGGIALANYLGQPTYQVLYAGISASEASGVTAQLDKDKVQYTLSSDGTTIFVPAGSVAQERLATASLLSSGAGGYSLLDNMGVTASEFQQNVTYKRAIEGELAMTIEGIQGVSSASVQLAIPQQTVFTDQTQAPTASVFVNVSQPADDRPGQRRGAPRRRGVPGPHHRQRLRRRPEGRHALLDRQRHRRQRRRTRRRRTRTPRRPRCRPCSTRSWARATRSSPSRRTCPARAARRRARRTAARTRRRSRSRPTPSRGAGTGATTGASGVLGTDTTNGATGTAGTGTGTSGTGVTQTQVTKNNAVNKTTVDQTIVPGTLNRQTIAVALNSKVAGVISTSALTQMVQNAAGVNLARGDTVSVTSVPFSTAAAKSAASALAASQAAQSSAQMTSIITTAIQVVGGIVLLVVLLGLLRKLFKRPEPSTVDAGSMSAFPVGADGGLGGVPAQQIGGYAAAPGSLGSPFPGTAPTVALPAPDGAFAQLQADVDALAGSDPAQTAEYLRALMGDRAGV